ncbi:MAG TPA: hypothetical protein VKP60_12410 [Magnetospirillaceae bacterium]|nr:hypothetical protein [Magnetospirillaceae bacterium]
MIRAALLLLVFASGTLHAEECGVSGTKAILPFAGTWRSEDGDEVGFGRGLRTYRYGDMEKPAAAHLVPKNGQEDADDVHLDCQTLDAAGIDRMLAELDEYVAALPDNGDERGTMVTLRSRLRHPPYHLVTEEGDESISRFILLNGELLEVWEGEARLTLHHYRKVQPRP